jgi:hypothetical protein
LRPHVAHQAQQTPVLNKHLLAAAMSCRFLSAYRGTVDGHAGNARPMICIYSPRTMSS